MQGKVSSIQAVMIGDRDEIRRRAAQAALNLLLRALAEPVPPADSETVLAARPLQE
jgi:hypothetical protein